MDQHRQEPGCPNECLKLQADVVSSCTFWVSQKRKTELNSPSLLTEFMLSDSQVLFASVLSDFWLCVGSERCWRTT